ncbi:uncharacterized protein LOC135520332 [Oncorhynchus masou masou]|uniref:uncharacterized protein LOC135520332 n=1 Tax=Oncorhynchus masou masou TaxID=90313 RepID=UPI003183D217
MSYTNNHHIEANAVQRVASLPLFDSALKSVVSVYTDVKGRYPLLSVVGGVAEIGVRNVSQAAILRATPLLLSLEPQIEVVNNYACMGLDQLENNFPVLHQSTEEVLGHLKDAFFLTLDDVQLRVNDELDGMQGRWDKLTDATWYYLLALQESQLGQMATSGLDDILTRSEEAMAKYMPLTATLRLEWERRTQQYEDEDGEDEPGLWTRFRGLLLCLSLQLYRRLLKLRNRLERAMGMLQDATDRMGLSRLLEVVSSVLQMLKLFYVSQVLRLEATRRLALDQLKAQVRVLAELGPINQLLGLPAQVQLVVADLQELGKILLQLLVKCTPLYNMLQQPSDQDVEDFLNQQESLSSDTTRSNSASSLFLKAMDGRPHNRKSSYARSQTGSTSAPSPTSAKSPNGSQKQDDQTLSLELKNLDLPSTISVCRRSSVRRCSSSSINPPDSSPVPGPAPANQANDDDQPLSRQGSQKPDNQSPPCWGSQKQEDQPLFVELDSTVCHRSSAIEFLYAPIIQYLSPEQLSDETVIPEVETTNFHPDTRDESLPRHQSLSARSQRSSSSVGNPDDQSLSRRGSQKQDDQPLSLELDPLELPSTSTVPRPSSAAEVLLGSILQYLSSEPPSDESIIPEVETTENHTETRDESPPRHKSLSAHSRKSSSSAGNLDNQPLSRQGNQKPDNQPLSLELDPLELPSTSTVRRPSSAAEVLLGSVLHYISSEPSSDEPVVPEVETTENHIKARGESLPRRKSLSSSSHWSLSSAVAPMLEKAEDLSPEQGSDEAIILEVEGIEYYSDTRDMNPPRRKSLSTRSRRSSSSAVAPEVETSEGLRPEEVSDEVITLEVESTEYYSDARDVSPSRSKSLSAGSNRSSSSAGNPDDQSLSRRGSQKPFNQPLSLELDPLELPSTSTVHRPSSAAEVLLGSILQYLSPEQLSDETVIPEVETTNFHPDTRDVSPSRSKSLSAGSNRCSSSAGNPDNQSLSRRGSQKQDDQPLSLELDPLELPSTSTVRRPSSAAEVLLGSILQYLSSEPPSDKSIIPEVETTENHTEIRDESPPRHKSSSSAGNSDNQPLSRWGNQKPDNQPLSRRGNQMSDDQSLSLELEPLELPSTSTVRRSSSTAEVLLGSVLQYINSEPSSDEPFVAKVETTENHIKARVDSLPRRKSLSSSSHLSLSSAVAPVVEITEDLSPEQGSGKAVALEVESIEYYSDTRDMSPPRCKSLSARSRRSSSSVVATEVETTEGLRPEQVSDEVIAFEVESTEYYSDARGESPSRRKSLSAHSRRSSSNAGNPDDQPLSNRGSQKPDDQSLSRWGSQKPDDQPLSLELDPLELPSTSTVRRPSSAAEVLLGSILQYFSSEPPLEEPVVPEVDNTENTEVRDESPPRCKSLSVRSRRSSSSAGNPSNVCQGSQMRNEQPLSVEFDILDISSTSALRRRSLAAEVLLGPILQYLSSEPPLGETIIPKVETTENQTEARDESPPRHKSLFARSRWSSYIASAPEVETTEDQSPEKVSDEAVALEGESTEYYSDARDVSPSRSSSLSAGSHRSSSSAGNLDVQPLSCRGSQMPDDQPLSRRGSQKPDDQPLSRWGSQKPDDQPLSLELEPLELPSTSTVRRPSSAAEVLLGSILQYISSEPPLEEPVVPEVDNTENTEVRDESPPRCKSLSVRSRRSSSSAGNPSNVCQGSQMRNDQPLSVEFDILDISSTSALRCRSLAAEVLLGPILQYLSSEPSSDETVIPEVETTEKNAQLRDESPPRHQSLSPRSRRSSSSAVVPEVETTEYCFDEGDGSPLRRKSLSIRSRRSSSSGGNAPSQRLTPDNTHNGLQGSQMQDNLDELDTSAVRRRSWAVEVLLDPILQYLNPGHSEKADIEEAEIPAVEATEH